MNDQYLIGRTKGPGQTPHEFTFLSPDHDQNLKVGEFTYHTDVNGQKPVIFSRIMARKPLRLYPDVFAADPTVSPDEMAALFGYEEQGHELFEMTASVIGYYDNLLGDFINPRLPPRNGRPIYLATDKELAQVLTKKPAHEEGAAHIGSWLSRESGHVPINIDVEAITSTHLAIIANTGGRTSLCPSQV